MGHQGCLILFSVQSRAPVPLLAASCCPEHQGFSFRVYLHVTLQPLEQPLISSKLIWKAHAKVTLNLPRDSPVLIFLWTPPWNMRIFAYAGLIEIMGLFGSEPLQAGKAELSSIAVPLRWGVRAPSSGYLWKSVLHAPGVLAWVEDVGLQEVSSTGWFESSAAAGRVTWSQSHQHFFLFLCQNLAVCLLHNASGKPDWRKCRKSHFASPLLLSWSFYPGNAPATCSSCSVLCS